MSKMHPQRHPQRRLTFNIDDLKFRDLAK